MLRAVAENLSVDMPFFSHLAGSINVDLTQNKNTLFIGGAVAAAIFFSASLCCCLGLSSYQQDEDAAPSAEPAASLSAAKPSTTAKNTTKSSGKAAGAASDEVDMETLKKLIGPQLATLELGIRNLINQLFVWESIPATAMFDSLDVKSHRELETARQLLNRSLGLKTTTVKLTNIDPKDRTVSAVVYVSRGDDPKDPRQLRFDVKLRTSREGLKILAWQVKRVMRQGAAEQVVAQWTAYEGHPAPNDQADLALLSSFYRETESTFRSKSCKRERELELKRTMDYISTQRGTDRDQAWLDRQMAWAGPNCEAIRKLRRRTKQSASVVTHTRNAALQTELIWLTNGMFERIGEIRYEHTTSRRSAKIKAHQGNFIYLGRRLRNQNLDWYLYRVDGTWE